MYIVLGMGTLRKNVNLKVDYESKKAMLNGEFINLDVKSFCKKLMKIVKSWEENYEEATILDGLSYSLKIEDKDLKLQFKGKNKFPKNFDEFISLLKEVNVW